MSTEIKHVVVASVAELKSAIVTGQIRLLAQNRIVMQTAFEEPYLVAFGTARSLAKASGVSHATVTRVARRLGFAKYRDFRDMFRAHIRAHGHRDLTQP
jgi:DNA-binding MurR/RpiR family transcriptional regulator